MEGRVGEAGLGGGEEESWKGRWLKGSAAGEERDGLGREVEG